MIIPYGFFKGRLDTFQLFDNTDGIYSVFIPPMSTIWTNALYKVTRSSDNATAYLFADGLEQSYDNNSFISTTSNTTPSATTLGTWGGTSDITAEEQYCITPDNTIDANKTRKQTTLGVQPRLSIAGTIVTKNGYPTVDYSGGNRYFEAKANPILDSGESYTIFSVTYSNISGAQAILSTASTSGSNASRLELRGDRTNLRFIIIRDTTGVNYFSDYLALHDTANQRLLTTVNDGSNIIGYYNKVIQETTAWSGTYINDTLQFGVDRTTSHPVDGGEQFIGLYADAAVSNKTDIEDYLDTFFSIP